MLAQNFKTAADLGLKDVEVGALIEVLGMLERGEISAEHFDMGTVWSEWHCESVGCICGWAHHISKGVAFSELTRGEPLISRLPQPILDLFAMCGGRDQLRVQQNATPASAAIALRSCLTTGDADWAEALA